MTSYIYANKKMFLVDKHNFATIVCFGKVYLLSKFFASGKMGSAQKMLIKINPSLLQNLKTFLFNVYVYSDPNMKHLFVSWKGYYVMNHSTSYHCKSSFFKPESPFILLHISRAALQLIFLCFSYSTIINKKVILKIASKWCNHYMKL